MSNSATPYSWIEPADIPPRRIPHALIADARDMDRPVGASSTEAIPCRGEALAHPLYWQGRQWAATAYGVERRDGCYHIAADRLWENEHCYGWVRHMADKGGVDTVDFAEALRVARMVHSPQGLFKDDHSL